MTRSSIRRFAALALSPLLVVAASAAAGCSSSTNDADAGADPLQDQALSAQNKVAKWIYDGPLPALDSAAEPITMTVSQKGHSLLVTGILPKAFTGQLPYYVDTDAVTIDGADRTRVAVVYP